MKRWIYPAVALGLALALVLVTASCMNPQGSESDPKDKAEESPDGNSGEAPDAGDGSGDTDGSRSGGSDGTPEAEEPTVASPQLEPAPGSYEGEISVSVLAAEAEHEIYLTLDGSEPSPESEQYVEALPLSGDGATLMVRAVAVDPDGHVSEPVSGEYTLRYRFSVTVTADQGGTVHGVPDRADALSGETIELVPEALPGYLFSGWEPASYAEANPLAVTVSEDLELHARFEPGQTESVLRGGISINEILPDPSGTPGVDTDGDGSVSTTDEFVELVNTAAEQLPLSGLELWDPGADQWFVFPDGAMLDAGAAAVVLVQVASSGSLPAESAFTADRGSVLNNSGDTVLLFDPNADQYVALGYGGAEEIDPSLDLDGFSPTAEQVGSFEPWNGTYDGRSLTRVAPGAAAETVAPHTELFSAGASPGLLPTP
jgi:hypothetical protein